MLDNQRGVKIGKRSLSKLSLSTRNGVLISVFLRFSLLLLTFLNLQTFGEGLDFCFDGSNEGHRLNGKVIKYDHARSGPECVMLCKFPRKLCRSVNFRKTSNCDKNCEFLTDVYSERPELLLKDDRFNYYMLLDASGKPPKLVSPSSSPPTTQESPTHQLSSSCKELLKENKSLTSGVYSLKHEYSLEQYKVYCHMSEIPGCGQGGWTLVMKLDGTKPEFNYSSPYWTNNETYAVDDGLEGLTEKQTKLASYSNTPFSKICLGMRVNDVTKWISLDYNASSLYSVIKDGTFKTTTFGKEAWKSLIDGSALQDNCNREGFNVEAHSDEYNIHIKLKIGLVANNQDDCHTCNSCIGFGSSLRGCWNDVRSTTCGNMATCNKLHNKNMPAFGYILVQ